MKTKAAVLREYGKDWQIEEMSPWEPHSVVGGVQRGVDAVSAMLIRTCEYVDNRHTEDPEEVLRDLADTLARSGAYVGGGQSNGGVVLGPEHAQMLGRAGYSRADVQARLYDLAVRDRADPMAAGKGEHVSADTDGAGQQFPMMPWAQAITVFVAGAGAANAAMSMVFRPFGWTPWSGRTVPVTYSYQAEEARE